MLAIAGNARIFFFQKPIDMRKGVESLSLLVEENCAGELTSGAYFVFINRSRDRMKVLLLGSRWICNLVEAFGKRYLSSFGNRSRFDRSKRVLYAFGRHYSTPNSKTVQD